MAAPPSPKSNPDIRIPLPLGSMHPNHTLALLGSSVRLLPLPGVLPLQPLLPVPFALAILSSCLAPGVNQSSVKSPFCGPPPSNTLFNDHQLGCSRCAEGGGAREKGSRPAWHSCRAHHQVTEQPVPGASNNPPPNPPPRSLCCNPTSKARHPSPPYALVLSPQTNCLSCN